MAIDSDPSFPDWSRVVEWIQESRFLLTANTIELFPSEYENFRDFLLGLEPDFLVASSNPLDYRSSKSSTVASFRAGQCVDLRETRRLLRPPLSHVVDWRSIPRGDFDVAVAFNPVACAFTKLRTSTALRVHWGIDFVPKRDTHFVLDATYRLIERSAFAGIGAQIENSNAALKTRGDLYQVPHDRRFLAPIGVFAESFSPLDPSRFDEKRIVYLGSLDDRNGASRILPIVKKVLERDAAVSVDIIGSGPHLQTIREDVQESVLLRSRINVHGYVAEQSDVDRILRRATVAIAPFTPGSFTTFADPQKLKYYLANGLPIFLSDVPPNATELERCAGALRLEPLSSDENWSAAILRVLNDQSDWLRRSELASNYGTKFERKEIYQSVLKWLYRLSLRGGLGK